MLTDIEQQAAAYAKVREALAVADLSVETRKILFLDSLGLATGSILSRLMGRYVPSDVQQAYEMAYPQKAAAMDFKEAVNDLDEDQLDGFISGVKGKLFEIKYTDYLNDGRLRRAIMRKWRSPRLNPAGILPFAMPTATSMRYCS